MSGLEGSRVSGASGLCLRAPIEVAPPSRRLSGGRYKDANRAT